MKYTKVHLGNLTMEKLVIFTTLQIENRYQKGKKYIFFKWQNILLLWNTVNHATYPDSSNAGICSVRIRFFFLPCSSICKNPVYKLQKTDQQELKNLDFLIKSSATLQLLGNYLANFSASLCLEITLLSSVFARGEEK